MHSWRPWKPTTVGLLLVLTGLSGCQGKPPAPKLVPVRGQLLCRGKPLASVGVQFIPNEAKGTTGPSATGSTDANGTFTLQTPPYGPGAPPGFYRVVVATYPGQTLFPPRYANIGETPLHAEIPAEGTDHLTLKIED
jgi:hypothetical protein